MGVFSIPIFFIVFRETLEAAIVISVLLGLVEQIVRDDSAEGGARIFVSKTERERLVDTTLPELRHSSGASDTTSDDEDAATQRRKLVRKLRIQVSATGKMPHFQDSRRLAFVNAKTSISPPPLLGVAPSALATLGFIVADDHIADLPWLRSRAPACTCDRSGLHRGVVHGGI